MFTNLSTQGRRRLQSLVGSDDSSEEPELTRRSTRDSSRATSALVVADSFAVDDEDDLFDVPDLQTGVRFLDSVTITQEEDFDRDAYRIITDENRVQKVLQDEMGDEGMRYAVRFGDTRVDWIPAEEIAELENGNEALDTYERGENSPDSESAESASEEYHDHPRRSTRSSRRQSASAEDDDDNDIIQLYDSDEEQSSDVIELGFRSSRHTVRNKRVSYRQDLSDDSDEDSSNRPRRRPGRPKGSLRKTRLQSGNKRGSNGVLRRSSRRFAASEDEIEDIEDSESDSNDILRSDLPGHQKKRRRLNQLKTAPSRRRREIQEPTRRSDRSNRARNNMGEIDENRIYRSDSDDKKAAAVPPKPAGAKENFQPLPRGDKFRERHITWCDTCGNSNNSSGQFVYCQGCSMAYHRPCLGHRTTREHLVTKIGEEDCVLQCRRCVNTPQKKDPYAPDLARCQDCRKKGPSCTPFRTRKTPAQEQKEREENDGDDPIYVVPEILINKPQNALFRCTSCSRAWHFHHLPPRSQYPMLLDDEEEQADARFQEYRKDFKCKDCAEMPSKIGGIVAWRPTDVELYTPNLDVAAVEEDEKEYLIRWHGFSYFRAQWMPGAWVWGAAAGSSRAAFFKKYPPPKMRTEDAIPEEWLRIDIVLDVKYTSKIDMATEEIDKARIKEVDTALLKYKGLGYEDAVWEKVPRPEDGDRWTDFETAYNDWILGKYTHMPRGTLLRERIAKVKAEDFEAKEEQPSTLEGGQLMKYQLEGMNWLRYQWFHGKNGILADEMGLGKTIQVIAFLATMVQELKCFPFLVVVPNSTCPNWRREIKQWAPSLRVVTYYGSATAREMAHKYELYPNGSKTLRCHVVVTSYEAATDESSRKLLKSVSWQGLIVDEGQRLKNDQSQLHTALNALKVPFRVLLTGTPLQNNARELFNLLQFLDDAINAEDMEKEYEVMTNETISRLHGLIRPFILRRTKLQVLDFLPPMAQVILPVSMSYLQKQTYKSILEQKPELLRSLLSEHALKSSERVGLNNILMQLRKCLCHPFVYNKDIEERNLEQKITHSNLVEASSKLQLLELLLPRLQERGHRVLMFSQFLDMLDVVEDFLDGMGMSYQRLDGSISSLEKQKRIDEFNSAGSPLFAFLLSTRAGGVGINLATADTVIILDPDFNPHQDIQAISRAHRIGQTKKVLCFQLMTKSSAEEKMIQVGRKKMALDEVVIKQLDEDDLEQKDMAGILKHGMAELFDEDKADQDIHYDEAGIEKLLDRSQIENTKSGADNTAESTFSFARIWENDKAGFTESLDVSDSEAAPNPDVWQKMLEDRAKRAAERAAKQELGRGKRQRVTANYNEDGVVTAGDNVDTTEPDGATDKTAQPAVPGAPQSVAGTVPEYLSVTPEKPKRRRKRKQDDNLDSDTDFHLSESDESADEEVSRPLSPQDISSFGGKAHAAAAAAAAVAVAANGGHTAMQVSRPVDLTTTQATAPVATMIDVRSPAKPKPVEKPVESLANTGTPTTVGVSKHVKKKHKSHVRHFKRAHVPLPVQIPPVLPGQVPRLPNGQPMPPIKYCPACSKQHPQGSCPLKIAGVEHCNICGLAHFGHGRVCPHFKSETMVRTMIDELRLSSEPRELVQAAVKYLKGLKGHLVQNKKLARERAIGIVPGSNRGPGVNGAAGYGVANLNGQYPATAGAPAGVSGFGVMRMGGPGQQQQQGQAPAQGSEAWNQMSVEDRLQGALATFGQ